MTGKFVSFLEAVGRDFKNGFQFLLDNPAAVAAEQATVQTLAPELVPAYTATRAAVILAEQNSAALGKQSGTGTQKSAAVLQIAGGLIKQGLSDAGMASDDTGIQKWIDYVVTGLNAAPAPTAPAK